MDTAWPSIPVLTYATSNSLTIQWVWNCAVSPISCQICYRQTGDRAWMRTTKQGPLESIKIGGLHPDTEWEFKIRGGLGDGSFGRWSPVGGPHRTLNAGNDSPHTSVRGRGATSDSQQRSDIPNYSGDIKCSRAKVQEQTTRGRTMQGDSSASFMPEKTLDTSETIREKKCGYVCPPPRVIKCGINYIKLQVQLHEGTFGDLLYRPYNARDFRKIPINYVEQEITVSELQPYTYYEFFIRETVPAGETIDSQCCEGKTKFSAKHFADLNSSKKLLRSKTIKVSKLQLKRVTQCDDNMTRILQFGPLNDMSEKPERTLMLVGATGVGKSTLLDGMVNYLLGVNREDAVRYSIIDTMDNEEDKPQTVSQTEWITMYKINAIDPERCSSIINIIDTPGFGDTRGLDRDRQLVEQIREFFNRKDTFGVKTLDAVCFVANSSDSRLTATQKYICSAVLGVFGKDIAENIVATLTFSDGSMPVVLPALRKSEVPFDKFFTFNNAALFESPDSKSDLVKSYWNIGRDSYAEFFLALENMTPRSLLLTAEVLEERRRLELVTKGLTYAIEDCLRRMHNLGEEEKALKEEQKEMRYSKHFTYNIKECQSRNKKLTKGRATNCLQCNRTCHTKCSIKDDKKLYKCDVMDVRMDKKSRLCLLCHCLWSHHVNIGHEIVREEITITKTDESLRQKYKQLQGGIQARKDVISQLNKDIEEVMKEIRDLIQKLKYTKQRLCDIALRPNPMSDIGFIDLLIEQEKNEGREGFNERISCLKRTKDQAQLFDDVNALERLNLKI